MKNVCTIPELRTAVDVAHSLAKMHVGFVVVPVTTRDEFVKMTVLASEKLEEIAQASEKDAANG